MPKAEMNGPFEARFAGCCGRCDTWFPEKTLVRYDGPVVVHAGECPDPMAPNQDICTRCFTEKSAAGTCGCDG